jgi:hypothetical protein
MPKIYRIVKFVASSFGLDSIPLTQVSILGTCYETLGNNYFSDYGGPQILSCGVWVVCCLVMYAALHVVCVYSLHHLNFLHF